MAAELRQENTEQVQTVQPAPAASTTDNATASTEKKQTPATKTYTEEEYNKALHAKLTQAGRDHATLESRNKIIAERESQITAREARIKQAEEAQEKVREEALKDNPEALAAFRSEKELKAERARLSEERRQFEAEKAQHNERLQEFNSFERDMGIMEIAEESGVNWEQLKTLADDLEVKDTEKIKKLAERLPKSEITTETTTEDGPKKSPIPKKVFNGSTNGGGIDLNNIVPGDPIANAKALARMAYSGKK